MFFEIDRMRSILIMLWVIFIFFPLNVYAHGVEGEVSSFAGGIVVTAKYDTGELMSYAKVEVYAADSKLKFQSGRTDRNGCFAFVPDVQGKWKVTVDDGIGHRLTMEISVDKTLKLKKTGASPDKVTLLPIKVRTFIGVLLIFSIWGWFKEIKRFLLRK